MKYIFPVIFTLLSFIPGMAQKTTDPEPLFPVSVKGRHGYVNRSGEMVITPQFDKANKFHDGLALVRINGKNISHTKGHYDYIGGDEGYIDKTGKFVITPGKYSLAHDFSEGLASVWISTADRRYSYGYIDTTGKVVIKGPFQTAGEFQNGTAGVRLNDDKWGVIDKTGAFIIPPIYEGSAFPFMEEVGIGIALKNKRTNITDYRPSDFETVFYNRRGEIISRLPFSIYSWITEGLVSCIDEEKRGEGFIDKTGKIVIEPKFERAIAFSDGLCPVRVNKSWGYIDKTGKYVVEPQYTQAFMFSEGVGRVAVGGKMGFIDTTGKFVIPPQNWEVWDFKDGLAYAWQNGERGLIDKTGKFIWKTKE